MRSITATAAVTTLLATGLGLGACGSSPDGSQQADTGQEPPTGQQADSAGRVDVTTFMFEPDPLRVPAGTRITWTNADSTVHTVVSGPRDRPDGTFEGTLEASGGTFSTTLEEPGTYRYFCDRHSGPGMEAAVVVE